MIVDPHAASVVRLARVTGVDPEGQKLDVIFLDTGDYGRDVQVVSPYAGTDFGFTGGIPAPEEEGHDVNMEENDPDKRHIIAVVACAQGVHLCLGFLYPQVTQMAFTKKDDKNRLIERHTSDFYRTVSDKGDMDMVHPGGAFIRVGVGDAPDNLGERDFDKVWKIKHNKGPVPVTIKTGGSRAELKPTGEIDVVGAGRVRVAAGGYAELSGGTTVMVRSDGSVVILAGGGVDLHAGAGVTVTSGGVLTLIGKKVQVHSDVPPTVNIAWAIAPIVPPPKDGGEDDDDEDEEEDEDGYWQWVDPTYGELIDWWKSLGNTSNLSYDELKHLYYQTHERQRVWVPGGNVDSGDPGWW